MPVAFAAALLTLVQRHGWTARALHPVDLLVELAIWIPIAGLLGGWLWGALMWRRANTIPGEDPPR